MGSDRARITFDPTREYRSVVAQQGRVTLEADVNEQAMIAAEALRVETIDLVGPVGTPNNGYQVTTDTPPNIAPNAAAALPSMMILPAVAFMGSTRNWSVLASDAAA